MEKKTAGDILYDRVSEIFQEHGVEVKNQQETIYAIINYFGDVIMPELFEDIIQT